MKLFYLFIIVTLLGLFFSSCEEAFTPPIIPGNRPVIVVESYIEAYGEADAPHHPTNLGIIPRPAYAILTNNVPFGSSFFVNNFDTLFVRGADVKISDGTRSFPLTEVCLSQLGEIERAELVESLGLNSADFSQLGLDFNETEFCAYIDLFSNKIEMNQQYTLTIEKDDVLLTATTSTPQLYPIDTIDFRLPPGDSAFFARNKIKQMIVKVTPVDTVTSYFRYFTQRNEEAMIKGNAPLSGFRSVIRSDVFGVGEEFVALPRGQARDSTFNTGSNAFGNYRIKDNYTLKWCTLDEKHYDFWNSTEFNALNQGFFSSYTQPQFNIEGEGGIGIFGGYSVGYYKGEVPKN
ncbi:MAG: DUF4249 family protein [Bacteroidota bacterium]